MVVDDKVTPLPSLLERLGRRIDQAWNRIKQGEYQWIEGSLELAQVLAEARERFPSDIEFGKWLKESGHDHWNEHDRAALIGLAGDPELAREILTQTDRRSYQHIWKESRSRFAHVSKPRRSARADTSRRARSNKRGEAEKFTKARELVRPRIEANQALKLAELEHEHGISRDTFERAALAEQARKEAQVELLDAAAAEKFSETGKLKIEDAVRIHKTRLDKQFEQRVNEEVRRRIDAADDATRANNKQLHLENINLTRALGQRGVFTETQFQHMLILCHPDSSASPKLKAELLQILVEKKDRLIFVEQRKK